MHPLRQRPRRRAAARASEPRQQRYAHRGLRRVRWNGRVAASERAVKAYVAKYMDTEHKPCKYGVPPCPRCAEWGKIFWSKERVLKAITEYAMTEYI
jgi:hypothetical protein